MTLLLPLALLIALIVLAYLRAQRWAFPHGGDT